MWLSGKQLNEMGVRPKYNKHEGFIKKAKNG